MLPAAAINSPQVSCWTAFMRWLAILFMCLLLGPAFSFCWLVSFPDYLCCCMSFGLAFFFLDFIPGPGFMKKHCFMWAARSCRFKWICFLKLYAIVQKKTFFWEHTNFFLRNTVQIQILIHIWAFTPMNTRTYTLPLWAPPKDWTGLILRFMKSPTKSASLSTGTSPPTKRIISRKCNRKSLYLFHWFSVLTKVLEF
jgi:hypothetical protein